MLKIEEAYILGLGYNTLKRELIDLRTAGQAIVQAMYPAKGFGGMILFDGEASMLTKDRFVRQVPGRSISIVGRERGGISITSVYKAVMNDRGLLLTAVRVPEEFVTTMSDSGYSRTIELVFNKPVDPMYTGKGAEADHSGPPATISFYTGDDIAVLRMPGFSGMEAYEALWQFFAGHFDLAKLAPSDQFNGRRSSVAVFNTTHERSGIELAVGSWKNHYGVTATFPSQKTAAELRELVRGLKHTNPQQVDGEWVGDNIQRDGSTLETHISGGGHHVFRYLERLVSLS